VILHKHPASTMCARVTRNAFQAHGSPPFGQISNTAYATSAIKLFFKMNCLQFANLPRVQRTYLISHYTIHPINEENTLTAWQK